MAEDDDQASSFPPIDPTTFDLIIVGTGLQSSILAAAASSAAKTVLHLDPNPFYGSHFASLNLHELTSFLTSASSSSSSSSSDPIQSPTSPSPTTQINDDEANDDLFPVELSLRQLYSDVEITVHDPEALLGLERKFNLDLAGPRVLYRADSATDLVVKAGIEQYMEFRAVDATMYMGDSDGKLAAVPDSREAVFRDKEMKLKDKFQLTRFFKTVQGHIGGDEVERIAVEDLERPFVEFLSRMMLPDKIKSMILYAIAMADYDQDNSDIESYVLNTRDGIDRLVMYQQSVGRFNAPGAFLYPQYGQGELPQAFCRRAAVKGCIYVLRMPVSALLKDKSDEKYKGVRLASGQAVFSSQIILDPSLQFPISAFPSAHLESWKGSRSDDKQTKVARGICITRKSLKPDSSTFVVVYPPHALHSEQKTPIHMLQVAANLSVCPSDMFVVYISVLCIDADQGKKLLHAAMKALSSILNDDEKVDNDSSIPSNETGTSRTAILWDALYIQELVQGSFGSIFYTSMPDGTLSYSNTCTAAFELFQILYPSEEYFPAAPTENLEEVVENVDEATEL